MFQCGRVMLILSSLLILGGGGPHPGSFRYTPFPGTDPSRLLAALPALLPLREKGILRVNCLYVPQTKPIIFSTDFLSPLEGERWRVAPE
jgi:hypothetical protein